MPEMDGMEATQAIRALGGRFLDLPIVALTANIVSGAKEKFLAGGFNDFLTKPIDTDELDAVLLRWIPAAKQHSPDIDYVPKNALESETSLSEIEGVDTAAGIAIVGGSVNRYRELLRMFLRDAKVRFALLDAVPETFDSQSFITAVHALKGGLANIGANALSELAAGLEAAGRDGDLAAINKHLTPFREELAALTVRIDKATTDAQSCVDDSDCEAAAAAQLGEGLAALQTAMETRDIDSMDAALAKLQNLSLPPETNAAIADIAQHVLFGEFKKAAEAVNALIQANQ